MCVLLSVSKRELIGAQSGLRCDVWARKEQRSAHIKLYSSNSCTSSIEKSNLSFSAAIILQRGIRIAMNSRESCMYDGSVFCTRYTENETTETQSKLDSARSKFACKKKENKTKRSTISTMICTNPRTKERPIRSFMGTVGFVHAFCSAVHSHSLSTCWPCT